MIGTAAPAKEVFAGAGDAFPTPTTTKTGLPELVLAGYLQLRPTMLAPEFRSQTTLFFILHSYPPAKSSAK